MTPNDVTP